MTSRIEASISSAINPFKIEEMPGSARTFQKGLSVDMAQEHFYDVAPVVPGKTVPGKQILMRLAVLRVRRISVLSALVLLVSALAQAQEIGTVTLLKDGPLRLIRGYSMFQGAEGIKLRQGDILETGPTTTAQAQLEFSGGAVIELGPSSQLYILSQSGGSADIVLLSGWLKGETSTGSYRYSSPLASATSKGGNVLLHVTGDNADIFVERGNAAVSGGSGTTISSAPDKIFFTHHAGKQLVSAERPSKDFIAAMPISFRDVLPPRIDAFTDRKPVLPKSDHEVTYADVEHWLTSSPGWRRAFVARFKPRLQDNAFRKAISDHIASLPEWEPVLHPEDHTTGSTPAAQPSSPPGEKTP